MEVIDIDFSIITYAIKRLQSSQNEKSPQYVCVYVSAYSNY